MTTKYSAPVTELIRLTDQESGVVENDAYPDQSTYSDFVYLFKYQVPVDQQLVFRAEHTFSLYAMKLSDQALDGAVSDDGGTQAWDLTDANDADIDDMELTPPTPAINDAYYFGYRYPFNGLTLKYSTASTDSSQTLAWEYYNGSSWTAVSGLTDGTSNYTAVAGTKDVTWTRPKDWSTTAVLGLTLYWIRARVSAVGATPNQATGDQAWIHPDPTEMEDIDQVRVEVRDENNLRREILIDRARYLGVKEFQDADKLKRLDVDTPVVASGGRWIYILVKSTAPIDASGCYFELTCDRIRNSIIT
jgi:hypothetical protein